MGTYAALLERIEDVIKGTRQARWPKGSSKGGQFRPKGGGGGQGKLFGGAAGNAKAALEEAKAALNSATGGNAHPRLDDNGKPVQVFVPTQPSATSTWRNPKQAAVFTPGGKAPSELHGVPFAPWKAPKSDAGWNKVPGQLKGYEPPLTEAFDHKGEPKRPGAGVIVAEPDGRVWIVEPTNHFGGYNHSFPKGGKEPGIKSLQANAIKEAWEESGLKVEITGILGDYEGDTSIARYYVARRTGGTPTDVGWESQAVKLVPPGQLDKYLNRERDRQIAADFAVFNQAAVAERISKIAVELAKKARDQKRYPKGHPLGGQFMPKTGAKAANKKIGAIAALANAGDVAGLQKIKPTEPGKGANPYQKGVWKTWNDALAHASSKAATGAGANAAPTPKGKPATHRTAPMKLAEMPYHAPKPGGSNPGGIHKDADGNLWLIKGTKGNPDMARNEVLAARLYNAAGASAPQMRLVELGDQYGGGIGVASRMVDGKLSKPNTNELSAALAREHFAIDAWLANWDAVGLGFDNIAITTKGEAMRIDPGGALLYRAQGTPKGAAFNKLATEWDTMRDPKINPQNAAIFGKMTAGELAESAAKLSTISDDTITKLVNEYGPGDAKGKAALVDTLLARKQAILQAGQKAYPGLFNAAVAELNGTPPKAAPAPAAKPKAAAKPAPKANNVDADGLANYVIGADGKAEPKPVRGASKPNIGAEYSGSAYQKATWLKHQSNLEANLQAGNTGAAKEYIKSIPVKTSFDALNKPVFEAWANAKIAAATGASTGTGKPAATQAATPAPGKLPNYKATTKAGLIYWNNTSKMVADAMAEGNHEKAANLVAATNAKWGASASKVSASSLALFNQYAADLGVSGAAMQKPATAKVNSPEWWAGKHAELQNMKDPTSDKVDSFISALADDLGERQVPLDDYDKLYAIGAQVKAKAEGLGAAQTARAKATASVEAAQAAAAMATAAKPKAQVGVPPAMPGKPSSQALSSTANPNKTLLGKVDQVEAIGASFSSGKLSKDDALAQLAGISFGSNTYGKKAAAYKANVEAAISGGATPSKAQTATAQAAGIAAAAAATSAKTKPKAPKFDASRLTDPPDFLNWQGTGKGLSSKPDINQANQNEVKAIRSMAATGNLAALKAYTPKSPSKHVASYLQQVIEDVNLQLNPPPRLSSIKVGGGMTMEQSIKALAKAAQPLKNPSQILNKLALYPVLGKTDTPAASAPPHILKYNAGLTDSTYAAKSTASFAKLAPVKQAAVRAYTGSAYHDINSAFRAGSPTKQALDADAGIRESAIDLKPGTVLSRKVSMSAAMVEQIKKHGIGKIIQEFGISSTSINPAVWSGNVHFRMTAGPGVKGLYVGPLSKNAKGNPISANSPEQEVLLAANQRMLITGISTSAGGDGYGGGGKLLVDVTLLPND